MPKTKLIFCIAITFFTGSISAYAQSDSWKEFISRHRLTYKSTGDAKSKGLKVSFDYPSSWRGEDGKRPNTLQQVISENGYGLELCNLLIKNMPIPLPKGYILTPEDEEELFGRESMEEAFQENSKIIDYGRTKIEGQPAAWISFFRKDSRAGITIKSIWQSYMIYYDGRLIFFNCSVADEIAIPDSHLIKRFNKEIPLFQQMANSLVIHNKWKQE